MRFRVLPLAIRLALGLAAAGGTPQCALMRGGAAYAAPAGGQREADAPAERKRTRHKPARAGVPDTGANAAADRPERHRGSRTRTAKPPVPDPRAHVAPAVLVPPVTPKPVPKPSVREAGEPVKLPRFAALKTDETNMRVGPGTRYPIEWVYRRRDLPMEVEKEYDVWRYVRDPEGVRGWVHQVTLSERRTFMVREADATVRADANDKARAVAVLKVGVIGRLRACDDGAKWCQVQIGTFKGYLRRDQVWGLLPDEVVTPS